MPEIFIYSQSPLPAGRDEIEDDLTELLQEHGEVTGGGCALNTYLWNIDIEVFDLTYLPECTARIIAYLNKRNIHYKITIHHEEAPITP